MQLDERTCHTFRAVATEPSRRVANQKSAFRPILLHRIEPRKLRQGESWNLRHLTESHAKRGIRHGGSGGKGGQRARRADNPVPVPQKKPKTKIKGAR